MYNHSPKKPQLNLAADHAKKWALIHMHGLELEIDDLLAGLDKARAESWSRDSILAYSELVLATMTEKFNSLGHHLEYENKYLDVQGSDSEAN